MCSISNWSARGAAYPWRVILQRTGIAIPSDARCGGRERERRTLINVRERWCRTAICATSAGYRKIRGERIGKPSVWFPPLRAGDFCVSRFLRDFRNVRERSGGKRDVAVIPCQGAREYLSLHV